MDTKRTLRVSVTYSEELSRGGTKDVVGFLDTFGIFKKINYTRKAAITVTQVVKIFSFLANVKDIVKKRGGEL